MIRIGIVGAGGIAKSHAAAIADNPDCAIAFVADIDKDRAEKMAAEYNALAFTDYKDFDCEGIDAVILNLPHYLHCEATVFFLEKGVHVLCEKPMANTTDECDRMIAAAKKSERSECTRVYSGCFSANSRKRVRLRTVGPPPWLPTP